MTWRNHISRMSVVALTVALAFLTLGGPAFAAPTKAPSWKVIATGLNNPRGLSFHDSVLYVAEAGSGGTADCATGPEGGTQCYGATGSITRIENGKQKRVLTGLPSAADQGTGAEATGPTRVVAYDDDKFYYLVGGAPNTSTLTFGTLNQGDTHGRTRQLVNFSALQFKAGLTDTDPYSLYLDANHDDEGPSAVFYVADAAANNLVKLGPYGKFAIKASFPDLVSTGAQSVPTAVTRGPDGALYVSELTGFPFTVGAARIWRIASDGTASVYASGFTNIIDLAFGPDHKLYVLEIAKNGLASGDLTGALIRYDGHTHKQTEIASNGLVAPTGLVFDSCGNVYISNYGVFTGQGQVIEMHLDD